MLELTSIWLPGSGRCFHLNFAQWPLRARPVGPSSLGVEHRHPNDEFFF